MAIECFVITLIFAAIVFSFAHANRIRWIIATVPLAILPCANCIANLICVNILQIQMPQTVALVVILASAMASCVWIGIASGMLHTRRMKIPYVSIGILFNIVLGIILINYYMNAVV